MGKLAGSKSLKARLIAFNFIIICIIAVIFSISSYLTANKKTLEISRTSLVNHVDSISYQYQMLYEEMLNIILSCTEGNAFELDKLGDLSTAKQKKTGLDYVNKAKNFCSITGYGNYINRLSVFNMEGTIVQTGTAFLHYDDWKAIIEYPWFQRELKKNSDAYLLDLEQWDARSKSERIFPIVRKFPGAGQNSYAVLFLSSSIFSDIIGESDDMREIIVTTHTGKRVASKYEIEENMAENDELIQDLLHRDERSGILERHIHGKKSMVAYRQYGRSGILVCEIMEYSRIRDEQMLLIQTIIVICIACMAIGLMLSILFTNQVRKPIEKLVVHINQIAQGDFKQDKRIEGEDEIGSIGKVINTMSEQIEQLLGQRLNDEKEKNNLEIRMLQAQINPHFLYNTLDSIKWIAVIQKNSGIVKAVTALSGLLKNMAKGINQKITVAEELNFLNQYVTIEKLKYAEMFEVTVRVEREELNQARVIKMILQPLVENAIFSGLEPRGKSGKIEIDVFEREGEMFLSVYDNGVGISEEKLEHILENDEGLKGDRMSGIGLSNVDRRLKLVYGDGYGLKVESQEGTYTRITIKLPLEYDEKGKNEYV